ncbi:MAG TPA: cytochrome c [Acidiferrobacteraceae bacterium]|nr:cytochrome c [Acidiferrobacteraceae bacterium]HEX20355.1 cytochrome c [Acidiferrobacteraceae bacterium]
MIFLIKKIFPTTIIIILACFSVFAQSASAGEKLFKEKCAGCHTIGGGKLLGPDLKGVHDRRSQAWLEKFVKSSQSLIKSGDAEAIAVFKKFNKFVMPDSTISKAQIGKVLAYIKTASKGPADSTSSTGSETTDQTTDQKPASKEDIVLGQNLFQGKIRFENNGPTCISCHNVTNDAVIGGGVLAKELTTVFSKMGGTGVRAILGKAPFPVMEIAYKDKPLTDKEIFALVAFLKDADENHAYHHPRDYGMGLLISGLIGAFILFGFYSLLWLRRRKDSVNQKIYDRQVKSE